MSSFDEAVVTWATSDVLDDVPVGFDDGPTISIAFVVVPFTTALK